MTSKVSVELVYSKAWWRALVLAWFLFLLASVAWGAEAPPVARYPINQPVQSLADSLAAIARQTGRWRSCCRERDWLPSSVALREA
jgi:hypothetical protein